uniref:(northern house mosquito) hypothetical protein n=1 Tax=Culex pipiens TaxID=7175 RepID=A0A8D8BSP2_CULPI
MCNACKNLLKTELCATQTADDQFTKPGLMCQTSSADRNGRFIPERARPRLFQRRLLPAVLLAGPRAAPNLPADGRAEPVAGAQDRVLHRHRGELRRRQQRFDLRQVRRPDGGTVPV